MIKFLTKYVPILFSVLLIVELLVPRSLNKEKVLDKTEFQSRSGKGIVRHTKMIYRIKTERSEFSVPQESYSTTKIDDELIISRTLIFNEVKRVKNGVNSFWAESIFSQWYFFFPFVQIVLSMLTLYSVRKINKWRTTFILLNNIITVYILLNILFSKTI